MGDRFGASNFCCIQFSSLFSLIQDNDVDYLIHLVKDLINLLESSGSIISFPRWNDPKIKNDAAFQLFHLRLKLKTYFLVLMGRIIIKGNVFMCFLYAIIR